MEEEEEEEEEVVFVLAEEGEHIERPADDDAFVSFSFSIMHTVITCNCTLLFALSFGELAQLLVKYCS